MSQTQVIRLLLKQNQRRVANPQSRTVASRNGNYGRHLGKIENDLYLEWFG